MGDVIAAKIPNFACMNHKKSAGKRIAWIDIAKGLAMIAVMADHCGMRLTPLVDYFEVPAFFILSGLMVKRVADYRTFAYDKAKRLLIPYIIYNLLFFACFLAYGWFSSGAFALVKKALWALLFSADYPLWFLKALFWAYIIVGACIRWRVLDRTIARWGVVVLLALAGIGAGSVEWGINVNATGLPQGIIASPLLAAGYCVKDALKKAVSKVSGWAAYAAALGAVAIGLFVVEGNIGFFQSDIGNAWMFYPRVAVAFVAGALVSKAFASWDKANPIEYIGRNSMNYFCLHAFAIKIAQLAGIEHPLLILAFTIVAVTGANALLERCQSFLKK